MLPPSISRPTNDELLLLLYGLFKQAAQGDNSPGEPGQLTGCKGAPLKGPGVAQQLAVSWQPLNQSASLPVTGGVLSIVTSCQSGRELDILMACHQAMLQGCGVTGCLRCYRVVAECAASW
jgi:hypothetical protein